MGCTLTTSRSVTHTNNTSPQTDSPKIAKRSRFRRRQSDDATAVTSFDSPHGSGHAASSAAAAAAATVAAAAAAIAPGTKGSSKNDTHTDQPPPVTLQVKLLLLGAGESGKSTIIKQMRLIHAQGYSDGERRMYRDLVTSNTILAMRGVVEAMRNLNIPLADVSANKRHADLLSSIEPLADLSVFPPGVSGAIKALWTDAGVREAVSRSHEFQLLDSAGYFFDNVERLADPAFSPNDQDILRCRVKTTGIIELSFQIGSVLYQMYDVGGQRSERRKWIHCFENVTAIVFVVGLSEYDQTLFEDETSNRMQEALVLFDSICNSRWFLKTSIILFLNKIDLFKKKIRTSPLNKVFKDYTGGDDYESATRYIHNRFLKLNQSPSKQIYVQFTCATDTNHMKFVMASVTDIMIQNNLRSHGLL